MTGLRFFFIVVLILGVFFRFVNLDQKVFWGDETLSSYRIAGYTADEILQGVYTGREIGVEELLNYQRLNPNRSLRDTLKVLATEAPNHPPLYYIMARFWEQRFGYSVAVKRCLPALISLLVFPLLYWLCLELFGSLLTGWVAIALVAVSPIHVLYAQEVREYSLWTVTVLLSCASLLYALRVNTKWSWSIYAIAVALALYSHLFSALTAVGQGIYVVIIERGRWSKRLKAYLLAATTGLLIFLPWIAIFLNNESQASKKWGWIVQDLPPLHFYHTWVTNLVRGFFDVQFRNNDPFDIQFGFDEPTTYLIVPILLLVVYAIYFLFRKTPLQVWLFVLLLMASTTLPLVLPDLISGGKRSTIARYQLPSYLGIQLAIAYLLSTKLSQDLRIRPPFPPNLGGTGGQNGSICVSPVRAISLGNLQQNLWRFITSGLVLYGVISCVFIAQADTWWTKYTDYYNPQVARLINQSNSPLLCSESNYDRILSLSHQLDPKVRLKLVASPLLDPKVRLRLLKNPQEVAEIPKEQLPEISGNFSDIFLLELEPPRSLLRSGLKKYKNYNFKLAYEQEILFNNRKTLLWRKIE
jgi:uncharacterized membrane protein